MLSVLLLVLFGFVRGAMSSVWESGGMAAGLQMVKKLVSGGEFVVAGDTAKAYFLLEADRGISDLNIEAWIIYKY